MSVIVYSSRVGCRLVVLGSAQCRKQTSCRGGGGFQEAIDGVNGRFHGVMREHWLVDYLCQRVHTQLQQNLYVCTENKKSISIALVT